MAQCGFFPLPIDVTSRKGVLHHVIAELALKCEDQQPEIRRPPGGVHLRVSDTAGHRLPGNQH